MPTPLTLADAADLIDLSIQRINLKGSVKNSFYDQYYNVETGVVDYYTKDSSLSGLGFAGKISENASVVAASPLQGFDQTYTQVHYGILLNFTEAMWKFGIKKRNLERITREAVQSVEDIREQLCMDRLDNSFSTSYTAVDPSGNYAVTVSGGDSVAMISASHTREDGGTAWGNRITDGSTVNMDFDYDALKAAHRTAALIVGPKGKPMNVSLDTLVVTRGYGPHQRAMEILGAINRGYIPGSADRDGSAYGAFKIIATPWTQSNTSYWWMFDSSKKNSTYGLQYKEAQPISMEGPNIVFKTGEIQYKATAWFTIGFNDSRNWVGSKNTNAA
jgi:hypothetical protein